MSEINEKQIHILQIAERLFAEHGFDGTSIRMISKEAAINVAMVSYYFGSKESLLEKLIIYRVSDLKLKLENVLKTEASPIIKIENYVNLYIEKMDFNKDLYQILSSEATSTKRKINLKAFSEVKKSNLETLKNIVELGQNQNVFRKEINVALITPTILGTYLYFHSNKAYFTNLLNLKTETEYHNYLKYELTTHIQKTIKSLLLNESN